MARMAALVSLDLGAQSSPRELEDVLRSIASVQAWLDALKTGIAGLAAGFAENGRGPGAVHVVQRGSGVSAREARTVARRAEVTAVLPSFADALADGKVTAEHVDVLGRAMLGLSEAKQAELVSFESALLRSATSTRPDEWSKQVRGFVEEIDTSHTSNELQRGTTLTRLRIWQDKSRMVQLSGSLEPVAGERVWAAIRREANRLLAVNPELPPAERLSDEQATAQALVDLVAGGHAATAGSNPADLVVLVGLERLVGEPRGHEAREQVCETSRGTRLPVDWVRRMAHEARLIPLVVDRAGLAVELDRASRQRLATFVQRLMLRSMHDTCVVPGCDIPFDDCEVHHLARFNGRNTRIANLAPLCSKHHHDVHDRGWQITLDADRQVTIRFPDGTTWTHETYRPPPGTPPPEPRLFGDPAGRWLPLLHGR